MGRFSDLKNLSENRRGKGKAAVPTGGNGPVSSGVADAPLPAESATEGADTYKYAVSYLKKVFGAVKEGEKLALDPAFQIVRQMVGSAPSWDSLFIQSIQLDERQNFLVNKCVNVAIYSVRAAEQLGYSRERQVEIGMAALLHAVGMCRIPKGILNKKEQLTRADFETI
jgi:HD-GYP domain-containing protein (c-di-GMP phosphodiesterase class II)